MSGRVRIGPLGRFFLMGSSLTALAVDLARVRGAIGSKDEGLLEQLVAAYGEECVEIDALVDEVDADGGEVQFVDLRGTGQRVGPFLENALLGMLKGQPQPARIHVELDENDPFSQALGAAIERQFKKELNALPAEETEAGVPAEPADPGADSRPWSSTRDALGHMIRGEAYDERVGAKYSYALEFLCRYLGEVLPNDRWQSLRAGQASRWFRKVDAGLHAMGIPAKTLRVTRHLIGRGSPIPLPEMLDGPVSGYLELEELKETQAAFARGSGRASEVEAEVREYVEDLRGWCETCVKSERDLVCFYG